ncbi:hypothetical protein KR215_008356, partial [Drosophila sulfurigaster]
QPVVAQSPIAQPEASAVGQEIQQAIAAAISAALEQQTQILSQVLENGLQRVAQQQLAVHNEQFQSVPRPSPPSPQHQSFEELFGLPNRLETNPLVNQRAPQVGVNSSPQGSQLSNSLRPDRISQIIANWKLRYSGHSSMSIED